MTKKLLIGCVLMVWAGLLLPAISQTTASLEVIPTKLNADWESGSWDSGLKSAPDLNYQDENPPGSTKSRGSEPITKTPDANHSIEASTNFARNGSYSLKVSGQPPARRSEIGFMKESYRYNPGESYYYAVSYCPDRSYSVSNKFDTLITQWKPFGSPPNQSFKIMNDGTHRIFLKSSSVQTNYPLGELPLNEWTDLVFYFKWSLGSDGVTKIWKNGTLILDITGPTLVKDGQGYMQMGMYTCINEPRTIYIDNVRIGTSLRQD